MNKLQALLASALLGVGLLAGCGQQGPGFAARGPAQASASARGGFTPAWVKDAVFYQIFPERFANGNKANDPANVEPWGGKPEYENFFGGDLAGVRQRIPHLKALGVNALYFNPLFKASSNHKYNTADYMRIDPSFGTNAEFKSLLGELHRNGIRVILDGVFNHTGDDHAWFQDAKRNGASSKYWNYYAIWGFPVTTQPKPNYDSWWGFSTLPKLRVKDNREVQEQVFAVTEYWTRQGIDGWRLDVPNEIESDAFWREWRQRVRAINPNAYIVGEIWDDGSHWLKGDMFDSVMNYPFRGAMLSFFAHQNSSVDDLDHRLALQRRHYGQEVTEAMFNILSSHDVPRIVTEAGGSLGRAKEATFFQMVYPGTPVVYYGDELGMAGGKDPDNRRTMPWEAVRDNEMLAYVQKLVAIRKGHPALRGGEFRTLMRHNHYRQYAFVRSDRGEKLVVALNSGASARDLRLAVSQDFADGTVLSDYMTGKAYAVSGGQLTLAGMPPATGAILGPARRR